MKKAKHPDWKEVFSITPEFMAETMGNLKYDDLENFLGLLAEKIEKDGTKDNAGGRVKLAGALERAAKNIKAGSDEIKEAWRISKPHM